MSVGLYSHTTRATGTILTAAIYNSDHVNHITNQNPTMTGALSDNLSEHQSMSDPGGVGTEVLAANLGEELKQLRFCIERIVGKTHWYEAPATNLESVGGVITDLVVAETARFTGDITPAQITSNQNNYAPTGHADAFFFRLTSDAARVITGLAGGVEGRVVVLANVGNFDIALAHEDAASTAANRFLFGINGAVLLSSGESAILFYDVGASRWRPMNNADVVSPMYSSGRYDLFLDFFENAAPGNPGANFGRLYAKDISGLTQLAYRDSAGNEIVLGAGTEPATRGDILFRGATTWQRLAAGVNGQFLQTKADSADPIWANLAFLNIGAATIAVTTGASGVDTGVPASEASVWLVGGNSDQTLQISLDNGSTFTNLGADTTIVLGYSYLVFVNNGVIGAIRQSGDDPINGGGVSVLRAAPTAGGDIHFRADSATYTALRVM